MVCNFFILYLVIALIILAIINDVASTIEDIITGFMLYALCVVCKIALLKKIVIN